MKRYDPQVEYHPQDRGYPSARMDESWDGDYILFSDHQAAIAEKEKRIKELEANQKEIDEEARKVRLILLLNHGHSRAYLDDGELQCSECGLGNYDFKIPSLSKLTKRILFQRIDRIKELEAELAKAREAYNDLILCVGNKYPGETRHDTAKRYILDREHFGMGSGAKQALKEVGE